MNAPAYHAHEAQHAVEIGSFKRVVELISYYRSITHLRHRLRRNSHGNGNAFAHLAHVFPRVNCLNRFGTCA